MEVQGCAECARLSAQYAAATAARLAAEAELTAATFSRDAKAVKIARRAARSALANWRRAHDALHEHERTHVMTAGNPWPE